MAWMVLVTDTAGSGLLLVCALALQEMCSIYPMYDLTLGGGLAVAMHILAIENSSPAQALHVPKN